MGMSKSQEHLIRERDHLEDRGAAEQPHRPKRAARQSEMPVSEHGLNQESGQNKHNLAAQWRVQAPLSAR